MKLLASLRSFAFTLSHRSEVEREMDEELRSHIQHRADDLVEHTGLPRAEAERRARMELGSPEKVKEECREVLGTYFLGTLLQDIRFGVRMLLKSPGFAVAATLALAVGIGATTSVFSLVNAVLIRPLPYANPSQLVLLWTPYPQLEHSIQQVFGQGNEDFAFEVFGPSPGDFYSLQNESHSFTSMALFRPMHLNLATDNAAVRVSAARVTAGFFETLSIGTELGRPIAANDDQPGNDSVIVISHNLWTTEYGGDPNVLGRTLLLNGKSYSVIGVAAAGFHFPRGTDVDFSSTDKLTDVWVPWAMSPEERADHDANGGTAIARLRPGVSVAQAQAEMSAIVARLDPLHSLDSPDSFGVHGMRALVTPLSATSIGHTRESLLLLLGAVACVLLIACSNVAGLLMARAASRGHEISVRSALGAPRARLIRQLFTESLLLACGGGILGVLVAFGAIRVLLRLNPGNIPRIEETSVDGHVLLFCVGVSILTALLFGLLPAFSVSRSGLTEMLNRGGNRAVKGGAGRTQRALIAMEVALSMVLLASSGLMIRSLVRLNAVGTGYQPHATLTMNLALDSRYDDAPVKRRAVFRELMEKTGALPGVQAVGAITYVPLGNGESMSYLHVEGRPFDRSQFFEARSISPGYFASMGIPLIAGRDFTEGDDGTVPVAIVSQAFAKAYFSRQGALGRHFQHVSPEGEGPGRPITIVGIVPDVRQETLDKPPLMQFYEPLWHGNFNSASIVVRTGISPALMAGQIRSALRTIDPALALADVHTMDDLVSSAKAGRRFQTLLLSVFAGIALFLSLLGLYALLAYSVRQRTAEIGVRMALGAQRSHVLRMVLRQGLLVASAGILVGLAASLALTRLLRGLLFEVAPNDPETLLLVTLAPLIVALAASLIPAWRAARIDPMAALRSE